MIDALHAPRPPRLSRNAIVAGSVVLFHVAALWALQAGLIRRAAEIVIPATVLSEMLSPPAAKVEPPPPAPRLPQPSHEPVARRSEPRLPPPPQPVAIADAAASPNAPTGVVEVQPPAPPIAAPVAAAAIAAPAPAAPARVELPSTDADYLRNPKPAYPPISKRQGEQGNVLLRVLIGADGAAQRAEIQTSSGYDRLDQAALATVLKWRYVPGKRGGVAEAMWFAVPINFVLE